MKRSEDRYFVARSDLTRMAVVCGGHCYWVCDVCDVTLRRQIHVSDPTLWRSFLTQCTSLYAHSPYSLLYNLICHCIDFKLSALQPRKQVQDTLNATTKQS